MPRLRNLVCHVEWSDDFIPIQEYQTKYQDYCVETFIPVPSTSAPIAVHLQSKGYIAPGLSMFVYIDGVYQCNRNRQELVLSGPHVTKRQTEVDFRVRQKEEQTSDEVFEGHQWKFEMTETGELADIERKARLSDIMLLLLGHVEAPSDSISEGELGSIKVVVLRCLPPRKKPLPEFRRVDKKIVRGNGHGQHDHVVPYLTGGIFDGASDLPTKKSWQSSRAQFKSSSPAPSLRSNSNFGGPPPPANPDFEKTYSKAGDDEGSDGGSYTPDEDMSATKAAGTQKTGGVAGESWHGQGIWTWSPNLHKDKAQSTEQDHNTWINSRNQQGRSSSKDSQKRNDDSDSGWGWQSSASNADWNEATTDTAQNGKSEAWNQGADNNGWSNENDEQDHWHEGEWNTNDTQNAEWGHEKEDDRTSPQDMVHRNEDIRSPSPKMPTYKDTKSPTRRRRGNGGSVKESPQTHSSDFEKTAGASRSHEKAKEGVQPSIQHTVRGHAKSRGKIRIPGSWSPPLSTSSKGSPQQDKIESSFKGDEEWNNHQDDQNAHRSSKKLEIVPTDQASEPERSTRPEKVISTRGSASNIRPSSATHCVRTTNNVSYVHKVSNPEYLDTLEEPYAVFIFHYRSQVEVDKICQTQSFLFEKSEKLRLENLTKSQLIEDLMKAHKAAGEASVSDETTNQSRPENNAYEPDLSKVNEKLRPSTDNTDWNDVGGNNTSQASDGHDGWNKEDGNNGGWSDIDNNQESRDSGNWSSEKENKDEVEDNDWTAEQGKTAGQGGSGQRLGSDGWRGGGGKDIWGNNNGSWTGQGGARDSQTKDDTYKTARGGSSGW